MTGTIDWQKTNDLDKRTCTCTCIHISSILFCYSKIFLRNNFDNNLKSSDQFNLKKALGRNSRFE